MYLEIWQIIILCALFGFCAIYNRKKGLLDGIKATLISLQNGRIIEIRADGSITPGIQTSETSK